MKLYTLAGASEFLGLMPISVKTYASKRIIKAAIINGELLFDRAELEKYRREHSQWSRMPQEGYSAAFETRYNKTGAYSRLFKGKEPYSKIAKSLGTSIEQVRQLRGLICPGARKKAEVARNKIAKRKMEAEVQRLFDNELYRSSLVAALHFYPPENIKPVPKANGYRLNAIMIDGKIVLLRKASTRLEGVAYRISAPASRNDDYDAVLYLRDSGFWTLPEEDVPSTKTTIYESPNSKYHKYDGNFNAVSQHSRAA